MKIKEYSVDDIAEINALQSLSETNVRHASDIIGEWGPWQRKVLIIYMIVYFFSPFQNLGIAFYAPKIDYRCSDYKLFNNTKEIQTCHKHENPKEKCTEWEYDLSLFKSTIINEWDLVCDRSWMTSFAQTCYQIGYAVSAIIFGIMSDSLGRLPVLRIAFIIEIISGFAQAFSLSVYHFFVARFFLGIGAYGKFLTGLLLLLECVGPRYRAEMSIIIEFAWALGYILLPGVAYMARNFRYIQILVSSGELIAFYWLWNLPESPRWQLTNGKFNEAKIAMTKAAIEKGELSDYEIETKLRALKINLEKEETRFREANKGTILDFLRIPKLLMYSIVMYISWFSTAFVYYGLSLNAGDFGGNLFMNFWIFGTAELASNISMIYCLKRFNRRPLLVCLTIGAGLACFAIIPFDVYKINQMKVLFGMIGKFCITGALHLLYLYAAEVFPTTLRQIGVGSCTVAGRVGSATAPFVNQLSVLTSFWFSLSLFGGLSVFAGFLILLLPETKGKDIPDFIREAGSTYISNYDLEIDVDMIRKSSNSQEY